jgi:hypothetical protein
MLCVSFLACVAAYGEEAVVALGKQRAAQSTLRWDVRDASHPRMGSIKVAVPRNSIVTPVRNRKIVSLVFFSCEKTAEKIAIELANASESDARGGLGPVDLPRLVCNSPRPGGGDTLVKSDLAATWEISEIGDALARGLSPAALRRCASIDVLQNVALPQGWSQENQRIAIELIPYGRELDAVFSACGEPTAFASVEQSPASKPPLVRPESAKRTDPSARNADVSWKPARTTAKGRTNVRASPRLDSAVVTQLSPDERVLVQPTSTEWWKAKPRTGTAFSGYIRQDRLVFD